jgi:hypothetical protein
VNGYSLEWLPEAENDLADIWTKASDRPEVNRAQMEIDRLLIRDPVGYGVEVAEGLRKIEVPPLVAYYNIDTDRRHVTVSNVARI